MAVLIVHLPGSVEARSVHWALVEAETQLANGDCAPGEAPSLPEGAEVDHVVALMPSECVFARRLCVPGNSDRDARRAAPFLIEEHLADSLNETSVEIGPELADSTRLVFAVSTSLRDLWRRVGAGLGIKPVYAIPDALVIETHSADLAAFIYGEGVLFKTAAADLSTHDTQDRDGEVLAKEPIMGGIETVMAEPVLQALAEKIQPRRVLLSDGLDPKLAAPDDTPIALKRIPSPDLQLSGASIDVDQFTQLPNVLGQGLISQLDLGEVFRPWRTAAALALVACLGSALLAIGQALYYEARTGVYREAEIEAFQANFPQINRVVNVQAQLRQQLAALGGGSGGGAYLELSAALSRILSETEAVQLESLRYDGSRGALSVTARYRDFADFEALQAAAEAQGVMLEDGGARQADNGVLGDFTVRLP